MSSLLFGSPMGIGFGFIPHALSTVKYRVIDGMVFIGCFTESIPDLLMQLHALQLLPLIKGLGGFPYVMSCHA